MCSLFVFHPIPFSCLFGPMRCLTDGGVAAGMGRLRRLELFNASGCDVGPHVLDSLAAVSANLEAVRLSGCVAVTSDKLAKLLS